jgi:MFS family permease
MTTYQIPLLVHNGVSPPTAALMVSIYAICWLFGGIVWGFAGERLAVQYALAAVYVGAAVAAIVILHAASVGPALVFALLFGLVIGGSSNLEAVVWADYYGRVSLGSIRGFGRPILMVANALAPPVAAVTIDALGSYDVAYWGFATVALMAAGFVLAAPPPRDPLLYPTRNWPIG